MATAFSLMKNKWRLILIVSGICLPISRSTNTRVGLTDFTVAVGVRSRERMQDVDWSLADDDWLTGSHALCLTTTVFSNSFLQFSFVSAAEIILHVFSFSRSCRAMLNIQF